MQTTYNEKMDVAVVGQLVDCTNRRIDSKYAEGAIDAGDAVQIGTSDNQAVTATTAVYGVAIQHPTLTMSSDTGLAAYAEFDGVSILRAGRIWVQVDGAVAIDGQAYWDVAAQAYNSTLTANFEVVGGRFITSTAGAGLAILEIS
jgi:hypothetical protein